MNSAQAGPRPGRIGGVWWLGLTALLGVGLLIAVTRTGLAIRGDSVRYVMGAENLLAGHGYSRTSGGGERYPETGFAPALSVALAAMGSFGADMFDGARLLNLLLFGLNILLVGGLIQRFTRSWAAAVLGSLLFLLAPNILESHAWLMSEALFVFLMLLSLASLLHFLDTGQAGLLMLSGFLAGMASVTRYIGLSLAPAGALAVLWLGRGPWRTRLAYAIGFAFLAVAPFAAWMLRNQAVGDAGLANRQLLFHMIRPDLVRFYLFEAATWALPEPFVVPRVIRATAAVMLAGLAPARYFLRAGKVKAAAAGPAAGAFSSLPLLFLLNVVSYAVVLVLNSILLDAATTEPAATRYLVPFFAMLVVVEICLYTRLVQQAGRPYRALAAGVGIVLVGLYAQRSAVLVRESTLPLGFTGTRERWAGAAAEVIRLAGDRPIITNNPEMVYYLIDRPAYFMPILYDPYQQQDRSDFEAQMELAMERMKGGSVLVIFEPPKPWEAEALERLEVVPLRTYPELVIYGSPIPDGPTGSGG
ncbi:MAG: glycosyltransferase family 39 protein [Anaerolineales bacterium]